MNVCCRLFTIYVVSTKRWLAMAVVTRRAIVLDIIPCFTFASGSHSVQPRTRSPFITIYWRTRKMNRRAIKEKKRQDGQRTHTHTRWMRGVVERFPFVWYEFLSIDWYALLDFRVLLFLLLFVTNQSQMPNTRNTSTHVRSPRLGLAAGEGRIPSGTRHGECRSIESIENIERSAIKHKFIKLVHNNNPTVRPGQPSSGNWVSGNISLAPMPLIMVMPADAECFKYSKFDIDLHQPRKM